jgi:hypothetical protein
VIYQRLPDNLNIGLHPVMVEDDAESSDDDLAVVDVSIVNAEAEVADPDDSRAAQDDVVVRTTREEAIYMMAHQDDAVVIDREEEKMALLLFPRVCDVRFI